MTLGVALSALICLQIKHWIADYGLQTTYMVVNKGRYGHPGGLLHAGFHGLLTAVVLLGFGLPLSVLAVVVLAETVVHYHIDWGKECISRGVTARLDNLLFWRIHGLDQTLHQATYVAIILTVASWA